MCCLYLTHGLLFALLAGLSQYSPFGWQRTLDLLKDKSEYAPAAIVLVQVRRLMARTRLLGLLSQFLLQSSAISHFTIIQSARLNSRCFTERGSNRAT